MTKTTPKHDKRVASVWKSVTSNLIQTKSYLSIVENLGDEVAIIDDRHSRGMRASTNFPSSTFSQTDFSAGLSVLGKTVALKYPNQTKSHHH